MLLRELFQEQSQPDSQFQSRCEAIVEKIATVAEPRYQQIIRSSSIWITSDSGDADKAYSSPKDRVVVIDQEEFATAPVTVLIWLIAHELGHIVMSHGPTQGSASQRQELDADEFANQITVRLGISRVPVFSWLGRRKNELGKTELERKQAVERDPTNTDFFKNSSHPTIDQRIKQAGELDLELSKTNTDQIDWLMTHTA
jgi:Zn-dependent protease with chaperone function